CKLHDEYDGGCSMRSSMAILCAVLIPTGQGERPRAIPKLPVFEGSGISLSAEQLAALGRGEPVVQMLNPKDGRVVAAFGIVAIKGTRQAFANGLTDFPHALRAQGIQKFGIFEVPTTSANVGSVAIDASDAAALRKCRTGKCEFKLPASEMARAKALLGGADGADGAARLAAYARRRVAQYVTGYRARGNAAMAVYDDFGRGGVRASDAFAALLAASSYLKENAPALQRYLERVPRGQPRDIKEIIYWSDETFKGLRPTVTINHLVLWSPPGKAAMTVAVTKQIYSDHYFEGMLDERFIVDRHGAPGGDGIYLMLLRQYRFDNLPGGILNIRGRARTAMQDRMVAELRGEQAAAR
ncbi:MAG: hypothetical protein ACHQSE_16185, partial [Gemmatimonadales bacterium]